METTLSPSEVDLIPDLLRIVDKLTQPEQVRVIQHSTDGPMLCTTTCPEQDHRHDTVVEHDPLLAQLETAIRETMAAGPGASSNPLAHTRSMLDPEALHQFVRIASMITDWARMAGAPRRSHPAEQLRAWYVTWTQQEHEDTVIRWHTRVMNGWVNLILDKADPTVQWEVQRPCPEPECPQGYDPIGRPLFWDRTTSESVPWPLVVSFRRTDGAAMVSLATARCRACGTTWGARELAWALEAVDQATEPNTTTIQPAGSTDHQVGS